ncbi:galactose mutarotase [Sphingobacterium olei]|uniref:Aldose 1-epimerase n=1 Tax=Sphingobacterium olei TaxID=2571155 RepID=A0A4U0P6Z9_9SPHI|nr:aldose epimerase family protein [Sphingobacterium olei]TJZ63223.1 galactose mutarotase [Sphingobacterium olei]
MKRFVIKNKQNMSVEILDWGCRIIAIRVPDKLGELVNTVLSYSDINDYKNDTNYLGCTVGRYANRIENGNFKLQETDVQLSINENEAKNHLHGGFIGFDKKYWTLVNLTKSVVEMKITSPDGEEGYPGALTVSVKYELLETNTLSIKYTATSDQTTIVNLTNHSYFNLSGDGRLIDNHEIKVNASYYTPMGSKHVPIAPFKECVENSIFDLRDFQPVRKVKQTICNVNYVIEPTKQINTMSTILDTDTNRQVTISSDYPSLQVYFGNYLSGKLRPFQGLCCEPHYPPNSPNIEAYPSVMLHPGEEYKHTIHYHFENF